MTLNELKNDRAQLIASLEVAKTRNDEAAMQKFTDFIARLDKQIADLEAAESPSGDTNKEEKPANKPKKPATPRPKRPKSNTRTKRTQAKSKTETTSEAENKPNTNANASDKEQTKLTEAELAAYYETVKKAKAPSKLSWKVDTELARLQKLGYIYGVEVADSACVQLAIELNQDVECFVKGDATVTAKKGELVIMVHTKGFNFRQFNIISNKDNCALRLLDTTMFNQDGQTTALAKEVYLKKGKSPAKKDSLREQIAAAIKKANTQGEHETDSTSYWGGKQKYQAVAKAIMYLAQMHAMGVEPNQIAAVIRDKDNHIVFELGKRNEKGFGGKRTFLMLDEKAGTLTETSEPAKPFGLVDARLSELEKFGKPIADYTPVSAARYLDAIYQGRRINTKVCKHLEQVSRICQQGNCTHEEEQKYIKQLERKCAHDIDAYATTMPKIQANFEAFFKRGYKIYSDCVRSGKQAPTTAETFNQANQETAQ